MSNPGLSAWVLLLCLEDAFVEGRAAKPELVAETIRLLASHLGIKQKTVAISISGLDVMFKKIPLPTMTEDELDERMHSELGQYIPYGIDEVDVDYQIIDVSKDRPDFMDVLLVAVKKESISDFTNLLKLSGFEPFVVDVDFFALSNSFEASYGFRRRKNCFARHRREQVGYECCPQGRTHFYEEHLDRRKPDNG